MRSSLWRLSAVTLLVTATFTLVFATSSSAQNQALRLGPSNSDTYVNFGNPAKLGSPTFSGAFTAETWFKRQGPGVGATTGTNGFPANGFVPLVTKGAQQSENSSLDEHFLLGIDTSANVIAADFEQWTPTCGGGANAGAACTTNADCSRRSARRRRHRNGDTAAPLAA